MDVRRGTEELSLAESFRAWETPVPKTERTISVQLLAARSSSFLRFALAGARLIALLFRFACFALRLFLYRESRINPFQVGDGSGIALALTELHNPGVTAIAIRCAGRDLVE